MKLVLKEGFMKELEAILTPQDGNTNSSPCSLSIYYTSTCYFCKASQQLYEVAATISMLQKKKRGLIGQFRSPAQGHRARAQSWLHTPRPGFFTPHKPEPGPNTLGKEELGEGNCSGLGLRVGINMAHHGPESSEENRMS